MKTTKQSVVQTALCAAVLAAALGCAEKGAVTRTEAPGAETAIQARPEPAEAKSILMNMARFLATTSRFSVNMQDSYDVVQESGQKIEFGESRQITVNRPNGLHIVVEQSDGDKHLVFYDGKEMTSFSPSHNVYAQVSKPGGIDAAIMYFLRDLKMRLPLAMLLVSRFPEEIEQRTQSLEYVERTEIHGKAAHHLAGRTETVDYQVWIAEGAQPLPIRVVLTYKNEEGQPQFHAQFSDWNLAPEINDSQFAFTPPEGARKISFLAELPQIAFEGAKNPEQTGGQK